MTKLQEVRAKVIEAVPEIVELKPGCILDLYSGESFGWATVCLEISFCRKHKKYREDCGAEENGCSVEQGVKATAHDDESYWLHDKKLSEIKSHQIIGRPITLADVLRAIGKRHSWGVDLELDPSKGAGIAFDFEKNENSYRTWMYWNLALPLDEQEPEVIAFLHKILV